MVRRLAVEHGLTGGAGYRDFKVGKKVAVPPDGVRAETLTILAELGHKRILHPERSREMSHERGEKLVSSLSFDPFDNSAQGGIFHKWLLFIRRIPRAWVILPVLHSGLDISLAQNSTKTAKRELLAGRNNGNVQHCSRDAWA